MTDHAAPPKLRDFSLSLPMMLLRAREAVMGRFRSMLRDNGLTEQQWRVLRALGDGLPVDGSQLAAKTHLLAPSLTRILHDLEAAGLIAIQIDHNDQRRKAIKLLPKGRKLIELITPMSVAIYDDIGARFGRRRLKQLQILLEELRQVME